MKVIFIVANTTIHPSALQQPHVTLDHFDDNSLKGLRLGVDWAFFKVCSTRFFVLSFANTLLLISSVFMFPRGINREKNVANEEKRLKRIIPIILR